MASAKLHFRSLQAFEAAARLSSISAAAEELCVTRTAVTHQVKHLERRLGVELLLRTNRGVRVTDAGRQLLPVLAESFGRIAHVLDGLTGADRDAVLHVTTTPTFAAKWLVPRLSQWRATQAAADIHLVPTLDMLRIDQGAADVGIRSGLPPWAGLEAEMLLPIHMTPLCSPSLAATQRLENPADVLNFTLIHADIDGHVLGEEWRSWLTAAGVGDLPDIHGLSFHDPALALQAAIDGLGVAIGYLELAGPDIAAGRLVRPFDLAVRHSFSYYLTYSAGRAGEPKIAAFRDWIMAVAGAELHDAIR